MSDYDPNRLHREQDIVMFLGWLTAAIPELHNFETPRMLTLWDEYQQKHVPRGELQQNPKRWHTITCATQSGLAAIAARMP